MPAAIPSWLNPPKIEEQYAKGVQIGASIGQEQQRLAAEHERTIMEAQARQESAKQSALQAQARIATEQAYQTAQIGLKQQQLGQAATINATKTREAALTLADRTGLAKAVQSGVPIRDAMFQFPRAFTSAQVMQGVTSGERLGESKRHNAVTEGNAGRALDLRDQALTDKENKVPPPRKTGSETTFDAKGNAITKYTFDDGSTPPPAAAATRQAVGKYKIGTVYKGGLKYLGGDPADEASWQKTKQ